MTELTKFEQLALEKIDELKDHIMAETTRIADEFISNWKTVLYCRD